MTSTGYEPVKARAEAEEPSSSGWAESPSRLTPDSDSEDEVDLHDLENEHGLELRELNGNREHGEVGHTTAGAEAEDNEDVENGGHHIRRPQRKIRRASVASFQLYTPDEEDRVRRKLDTRLVLFVALLYLLSFLDRSNIGNAKVAGLTEDLQMTDNQFEWLLTAFYLTYICFEWMTLCFKIFPPHIYISCCVFGWGVLASLQALANSWTYMLVVRILLGIGEAAFVGIPFYLSFFYRREELAMRVGLFIAAAPLATMFASSLAWGIVQAGDNAGISSWRLLFLVEGCPACLVSVWAWFWIPDSPGTARWLNARERKIATLRMRKEVAKSSSVSDKAAAQSDVPKHKRKFQWEEVWKTIRDPKSYLVGGMFFCCNVAFSSMPVFLPSIIDGMGYSRIASQGLSAPPFGFAFIVVLITSYLSDRYDSRSIPMMFHGLLAMSGYLLATIAGAQQAGPIPRYLATFPICAGFFSAVTIVITWTINNQASDEGKGTGIAILQILGQMGPLLGTRLYPDSDGPFYVRGMAVCTVAMAFVFVLALTLRVFLMKENARRRAGRLQAEGKALVGESRKDEFVFMI